MASQDPLTKPVNVFGIFMPGGEICCKAELIR